MLRSLYGDKNYLIYLVNDIKGFSMDSSFNLQESDIKTTGKNNTIPTVILATRNTGKIQELKDTLCNFKLNILCLEDFPEIPEIEETGKTFEENALIKAKVASQYTGLIAIADDSGLEVDILNGAPGVYSSRYAEDIPNIHNLTIDQHNISKLLSTLKNVPLTQRTARLCTTIVAYNTNGKYITATGIIKGLISLTPKGNNGFGYDPIFFDTNLGKTFGELPLKEKKQYSHRTKALKKLLELWPTLYNDT